MECHISRSTKIRIFKITIHSIKTYGAEAWVINKQNIDKIKAVETKLDRITNQDIRRRMQVKKDNRYIKEKYCCGMVILEERTDTT